LSTLIGSVIKRFERLLEEYKSNLVKLSFSVASAIEYFLVKVVRFGDRLLALITYLVKRLSAYLHLLQISMIDSMIEASLWYGFATLVLILLIVLMRVVR